MTGDGIVGVSRDHRNGVDVVRVRGEVDLVNAEAVQTAVEATRTSVVVLDLTGVAYLDSSGLRAIDRGHRNLTTGSRTLVIVPGGAASKRTLVIVSAPDSPAGWTLRVAGFRSDLLVASLDAALASAARARE